MFDLMKAVTDKGRGLVMLCNAELFMQESRLHFALNKLWSYDAYDVGWSKFAQIRIDLHADNSLPAYWTGLVSDTSW